jgi:prepilin-type N-terminal cleavage/methylation domain-containing protein
MTLFPATKLRSRRPAAFTLIELMVSVAIIALILGILLPVLVGARKKALRTRMAMDLQNISQALEAYRQDFYDYPRIDYTAANPITIVSATNPTPQLDRLGAVTLCWALLAPGPATQDGADGPGFRVRGTQGQVHNAYIVPGKFNITGTTDYDSTINDTHGNPYLYFPGFKGANISATNGFVAYNAGASGMTTPAGATVTTTTTPMYNYADNAITINNKLFTQQQMETMLGDTGPTLPNTPSGPNGMIDGAEVPATTGPYLLWGAGPDDAYGPPLSSSPPPNNTYGVSDDVTNFN